MEQQEILVLESILQGSQIKRRTLLPWWIKIFCWIFLLFGLMIPFVFIFGVMGMNYQSSLYGLDAYEPFSIAGIINTGLFFLKAMVAYGLWTEKSWAVNLGIVDAFLGIAICTFMMFGMPLLNDSANFMGNLRIELALLIPYLLRLQKIKPLWTHA